MELHRVGEDALLVDCADRTEVAALRRAMERHREAGWSIGEIVPAARTVLLDRIADREAVIELLDQFGAHAVAADAGVPERVPTLVELPVTYDGPDLAAVARLWGCSPEAAARRHREPTYVVEFCGFAPGFGYCAGLPPELAVPRLDTPRERVPAGSVAIAGTWTAVYPGSSPGGWHLLGRTEVPVWRPEDPEHPALLVPGTTVRFVDA